MTVVELDRISMADMNTPDFDELFGGVDWTHVPDGYQVEVVEGTIYMSPQRRIHSKIIRRIMRALEDTFGMDAEILSDVRIDFPGNSVNAFCPDVVKISDTAQLDEHGRWHPGDIEFVAEVISRGTGQNDYGPKKTAYATAEVPVYLVADPYQGRCHVYTQPKDGDYISELTVAFGADIDLTGSVAGLVLKTDGFPRD